MDPNTSTLFESGVWLIPLFLIATLTGVYLLLRYWQSQTLLDLKGIRGELRRLQGVRKQMAQALQAHSTTDPEPYGSRVAALLERLNEIGAYTGELEQRHVDLQERVHWLGSSRWQALIGGPYHWFQLRRETAGVWEDLERVQQALVEADEMSQRLQRLSLEVAQQVREARLLQQQTSHLMDQLRQRGMHGDSMEKASTQEQQTKTSLGQVPTFFMEEDEKIVLEQADKDSTTSVHGILEQAVPTLNTLLTQAQSWDKQYAAVYDRIAVMQRILGNVEGLLHKAPSELNVSDARTQYTNLKTVAQNLHDTLTRMEIESMGRVIQETEHVIQIAQEMETHLKRTLDNLALLEKEAAELSGSIKQISLITAALGAKSNFPVTWGSSADRLAELNRQAAVIGPAKKPREPGQVEQDLARVVRLNEQQRALSEVVHRCEQQHAELTQILSSPELSQVTPWLQDVQQLAAKVKEYSPDNWSKADSVANLPGELQSLEQALAKSLPQQARSAPTAPSGAEQHPAGKNPIPEAELSGRLEEARRLADLYQRLSKRVETIRTRLTEIQKDEKLAQQQATDTQAMLNQVAFVVRSNPLLTQLAGQELGQLQRDQQEVLDELTRRQRNSLEKKVRQGNSLLSKIETTANRWLDQLGQDLRKQMEELSGLLTALDAIAQLDDQPVADARRLLASGQALGAANFGSKSRLRLVEIVPELKRRSDYWQSCSGVGRALEEMARPVIDSYDEANENRMQVQQALSEVAAWLRQVGGWPPTTITLEAERQELDRIDGQWQTLKANYYKALDLVKLIGGLSARYQNLGGKIQQATDLAEQEMTAVEEVEGQISDLAQHWGQNLSAYHEYPDVEREIRGLLDDLERELNQIKRQHKQKARNYTQTLQSLKALERKTRFYQVALDAIDASGNVSRRR